LRDDERISGRPEIRGEESRLLRISLSPLTLAALDLSPHRGEVKVRRRRRAGRRLKR
jgi:hypothetical protein